MNARRFTVILIALLAAGFLGGVIVYPRLPAVVPTHWNAHDHPNGFSPRWVGAFGMPLLNLAIAGLLVGLPRVGSLRQNFERNRRTLRIITVAIVAAMLLIQFFAWVKTLRPELPLGSPVLVVVGGLMAVIGNYMGKLRRNRYVGIRTPWTLASDAVWEQTHRVGGRWMVAYGMVVAVTAVIAPVAVAAAVSVGGVLLLTLWAMVYSWQLSRQRREVGPDPH